MSLSKQEKLRRCAGCVANRYNMVAGYQETVLDAPVNGDGCYSLATAKTCNKWVYYSINDRKPTIRSATLSCWHNILGYGTII